MSDILNGMQNRSLPGRDIAGEAISIAVRDDVSMTHVAARRGMRAAAGAQAQATLGEDLPSTPRAVETSSGMIVWAGPDQWLVIQPLDAGVDHTEGLAKAFKGLASVADVSDSRMIFRVSGTGAAEALSKGISLDFHDSVFKPGDVAITYAAHLGVIVWRLPTGDGYDIACARTFSASFRDWLDHACVMLPATSEIPSLPPAYLPATKHRRRVR